MITKLLVEKQVLKFNDASVDCKCMFCNITSNGMLQNHCTVLIKCHRI